MVQFSISFFDLFDIYKQDLNLINKNIYGLIYLKIIKSDPFSIKRIIEDWINTNQKKY